MGEFQIRSLNFIWVLGFGHAHVFDHLVQRHLRFLLGPMLDGLIDKGFEEAECLVNLEVLVLQ